MGITTTRVSFEKSYSLQVRDEDYNDGASKEEPEAASADPDGPGVPHQANRVCHARSDHGVGAVQGVRGVPGHAGRARLLRLPSGQADLVNLELLCAKLFFYCICTIRYPLIFILN